MDSRPAGDGRRPPPAAAEALGARTRAGLTGDRPQRGDPLIRRRAAPAPVTADRRAGDLRVIASGPVVRGAEHDPLAALRVVPNPAPMARPRDGGGAGGSRGLAGRASGVWVAGAMRGHTAANRTPGAHVMPGARVPGAAGRAPRPAGTGARTAGLPVGGRPHPVRAEPHAEPPGHPPAHSGGASAGQGLTRRPGALPVTRSGAAGPVDRPLSLPRASPGHGPLARPTSSRGAGPVRLPGAAPLASSGGAGPAHGPVRLSGAAPLASSRGAGAGAGAGAAQRPLRRAAAASLPSPGEAGPRRSPARLSGAAPPASPRGGGAAQRPLLHAGAAPLASSRGAGVAHRPLRSPGSLPLARLTGRATDAGVAAPPVQPGGPDASAADGPPAGVTGPRGTGPGGSGPRGSGSRGSGSRGATGFGSKPLTWAGAPRVHRPAAVPAVAPLARSATALPLARAGLPGTALRALTPGVTRPSLPPGDRRSAADDTRGASRTVSSGTAPRASRATDPLGHGFTVPAGRPPTPQRAASASASDARVARGPAQPAGRSRTASSQPHHRGAGTHGRPAAGTPPGPERTVGAPLTATAAQRWRGALAARPLETPRSFPEGLQPLLRATSAGGPRPRFTAGPATSAALAAAGAHGATTGSVVHLPAPPPARMPVGGGRHGLLGVIAHELTHARQPVGRPRFLLQTADPAADAEERAARRAGAGIVEGLPVARAGGRSASSTPSAPQPGGSPMWTAPAGADEQGQAVGPQPQADTQQQPQQEQQSPAPQRTPPQQQQPQPQPPPVDLDRLAEAIEERILRQLERRGGRYVGVF